MTKTMTQKICVTKWPISVSMAIASCPVKSSKSSGEGGPIYGVYQYC